MTQQEPIPEELAVILREDIMDWQEHHQGLGVPEDLLTATREQRDWLLAQKLVYYVKSSKNGRYYWFLTERGRKYVETGVLDPIKERPGRPFRRY